MIYIIEKLPSHLNKSELEKAIDWCCNTLEFEDILVTFRFGDADIYDGITEQEEENEFLVILDNKLDVTTIIKTIFHELVHVKQLSTGKLECDNMRIYWWMGEEVPYAGWYNELPWEVEANSLEKAMFDAYFQCTFEGV